MDNFGQRRFSIMGDNIFKIVNKIMTNQKICRLLKYQVRNPFSSEYEDVDGDSLLNSSIMIVPKVPDTSDDLISFLVARFDNFIVNADNPDFKLVSLRFDIACPYDEWLLDNQSLRPYLIMQEIDTMFNDAKLSGIGKLQFFKAEPLVLSPQLGGYSMRYQINEFN